jgi:hypothetical protein
MHSTILIRDVLLLLIHDDDHCEIYHAIILLNLNDPLLLLLLRDDLVAHYVEIFHDEINYVDLRELKLPIDDGVLLEQVLCALLLHDDFFLRVFHPFLILLKVIHHEDGFVLHDGFYHGQVLLSLLYVYPQDGDDLHAYVPPHGVAYDLL